MIIDGHLFNDRKRFCKEYRSVHEALDKYFKTDNFCNIPVHTLEYLLRKYNEGEFTIEEVRAGIFHLLDDFGHEIPVEDDWVNEEHWLGKYCNKKNEVIKNE